ncbi:MAG: hypothetical protein WDN44_12490 [Sphingomonas sp.]
MPIPRLLPILLLLAAAPHEGARAQTVEVDIANFKFTPSIVALTQWARPMCSTSSTEPAAGIISPPRLFSRLPRWRPQTAPGSSTARSRWPAAQTVDVHFTAPAPGSYDIRCTHFLHAGFGMTGKFVVR